MQIKIGSTQINNGFSGNFYLPYSIGLLQAYVVHNSSNPDRYNFQTPIYKRWLLDDCVAKLMTQDIVLFSTYVWNINISMKIAEKLKKINKNILIIFGGPSVPDRSENFLRENKFIDIAVHQEGERTIYSILEQYPQLDLENIPNISYIRNDKYNLNSNLPRFRNFDGCPSPYLSKTFNKLLEENPNERWLASWETNRGCPFSCTYCDWGSATNSKVARFEMDRLFAEIDWFSKHKVEFIFVCDANFGMLPRDYDLVMYAAEVKKKTGYPHVLSVQSTKNARERAYKVQKALFDNGLTKSINIAMQATDSHTLKSIKRDNISIEDYKELQYRFTKDKIPTYVDFILGLPGDTYEKFSNSISDLIGSGQHNRIQYNNLSILPNAEMANPEYIEEFKLETVKGPIVNMHGSLDETPDDGIYETQELVISTKDMPKNDWIKTRIYASTTEFLFFNKILQIPIFIAFAKISNLSFKNIFEKFISVKDKNKFPMITEINNFFEDHALGILKGKPEFVFSEKWLNIYWPPGEYAIIKLFSENKINKYYEEASQLLIELVNEVSLNEIIRESCELNYKLIKKPMIKNDEEIKLHYNILEFYNKILLGENIKIISGEYNIKIIRSKEKLMDWNEWARKVLWFGHRSGNYMYNFEQVNKFNKQKN